MLTIYNNSYVSTVRWNLQEPHHLVVESLSCGVGLVVAPTGAAPSCYIESELWCRTGSALGRT